MNIIHRFLRGATGDGSSSGVYCVAYYSSEDTLGNPRLLSNVSVRRWWVVDWEELLGRFSMVFGDTIITYRGTPNFFPTIFSLVLQLPSATRYSTALANDRHQVPLGIG